MNMQGAAQNAVPFTGFQNDAGASSSQNNRPAAQPQGTMPQCLRLAKEEARRVLEMINAENNEDLAANQNAAQTAPAPAEEQQAPGESAALKRILNEAKNFFPQTEEDFMQEDLPERGPLSRAAAAWEREADALVTGKFEQEAAPVWNRNRRNLPSRVANPFPRQFPGSVWIRVDRPEAKGVYLEGFMRVGSDTYSITAVPGEFKPVPPRHLQGFHRYIPTQNGGFWIRIRKI